MAEHEKKVNSDEIETKRSAKFNQKWERHPTSSMQDAGAGTSEGSSAEESQRRRLENSPGLWPKGVYLTFGFLYSIAMTRRFCPGGIWPRTLPRQSQSGDL